VCVVERTFFPVSGCLVDWWKGNLMATKPTEENIKKARKDFFLLRCLVTFQGDLGPLSNRSVVETSVSPVMVYAWV